MVSANAYPVMGGVETHIYEVAPRLLRAGFDITILTTDRSGTLARGEEFQGVSVVRIPAWPRSRDYHLAPGILRTIKRGRWDIVHCQGYHTLVPPLAMLASLRAGIPYTLTFHSGGHGSQVRTMARPLQRMLMRPLLARAAKLIAVADFEREFFARHLKLPADRFVTIPNGGEMPTLDQADAVADPSLIVSVGRLERYKGHHRVIAALPHLIGDMPDVHLRIAGSGPYEPQLRRLAHRLGVQDRVEIGSIPPTDRMGMATLMSRAALVTLLSDYEAHPVAVTEALGLRKRVLVADTSGLSEFAQRGFATAIPLRSTAAQTARAILAAMAAPLPAQPHLPTWDDCAEQLAEAYRGILRS